jgi:hypothetical protein
MTVVAGLSLLIPAAVGSLVAGVPTEICPLPLLTIIPAFIFSGAHQVAVIVPSLLFFVWNRGLLRGEARTPNRSYVLIGVLTILTIIYFVKGWDFGLRYQGLGYTRAVCLVNIVWIIAILMVCARSWNANSSFKLNLFLHWLLFAWLASYAFPYLGELP